eukprot:379384_1
MQNIHIIYTMAMQKDAQVDINANDLSKLIQNESHHQMIKFWMNHLSTHYTSNVAMNPDTMHGITPLEMALTNPMAVIKKKSSHSNAQRNTFHSFDITQSILTPQFRKQIITTNAQQMEPTQANNAFKVSYLKREVTYKVTADTVVNADRYLAPVIDLIHEHNTDLNDLQNCNYWDEVCTLWKMEHMKRISYGRRINPLYGYDQTLSFIQTLIQRMQYASSNALQNVWFVFHIGDNRSLIHDTMQKYGIYDVIESQIQTMDLTFEEHATDNDALKLFKPLASVKPKHDRNALLSNIRSKTRACNVEIDGFKNEIMYLFERMKEDIINDTVIIERISITHEQKLQSLQSDQVIYEELINTLEMKIKEHQINEEKMRDELAKIHRESIQKLQDTIADRDSLMTKLNSHNGITLQYDTKINDLMGKLKAVVTERDALREEIFVLKERANDGNEEVSKECDRLKTRLEGKDEEISDFYIEKLKENEEEIIADLLNKNERMLNDIVGDESIGYEQRLNVLKQWNETIVKELRYAICEKNVLQQTLSEEQHNCAVMSGEVSKGKVVMDKMIKTINKLYKSESYEHKMEIQSNQIERLSRANAELKEELEAITRSILTEGIQTDHIKNQIHRASNSLNVQIAQMTHSSLFNANTG